MGEGTGVFFALSRAPALRVSERDSILRGVSWKAWKDAFCVRKVAKRVGYKTRNVDGELVKGVSWRFQVVTTRQ